jgi:amino acid adenylation domain-containing protein
LTSLVHLLRWRAKGRADEQAYTFLADGREPERMSYARLDLRARAIAGWLQDAGMAGERALMVFPQGLEYITAFMGCLYARTAAVPAYPPRLNRSLDRLLAIVKDSKATVALTTDLILGQIQSRLEQSPDPELQKILWKTTDSITNDWAAQWKQPKITGETLAFLQYTSGSTATPRGVMVSHRNLMHNQSMIQAAFRQDEQSVIVGWLPLFHDMGLIGNVLQPLYTGARCILMSPVSFLQRPVSWLEAISKYRATTSGGPNFAYELCLSKITPEQRVELDLSSWRVAFNGAEPVRGETLERFAAAFGPCGFRSQAFYPCYGLAEATLFVAGGPGAGVPKIQAFDREALQENRARHRPDAAPETEAARLVSCGRAWMEQRIVVADPNSLALCPPGDVGEIWVTGPSVAQGYWGREEESVHSFSAHLAETGEGPFLRTGDMGFIDRGELYVTGRLKDLIIIRGRNHYPQDIERTVEQCVPSLRKGEGAAFSVEVDSEERLIVVYEIMRGRHGRELDAIIEAVRQSIAEEHELQVHAVGIIRLATILKTSSGKIQRRAVRDAYLKGRLEYVMHWQASVPGVPATGAPSIPGPLAGLEDIQEWIASQVAVRLGVARSEIDVSHPLARYGLDSLADIELVHGIESGLGVALPLLSFLQEASIAELSRRVMEGRGANLAALTAVERRGVREFPLSRGQESLWFLYKLAPESAAYNLVGAARIPGAVDFEALHRAFQSLVTRHPVLRARFSSRSGACVQIIEDAGQVNFRLEHVPGLGEEEMRTRLAYEARRPFHLEDGPAFRVLCLTSGQEEKVLMIMAHHMVADLWSLALLVNDLGVLYEAETREQQAMLPAFNADYGDYVQWQEQLLAGDRGLQLWKYWSEQMAGELPVLDLPTDRPRPPVRSYEGASHCIRVSPEIRRQLRALARRHDTTLFTVLLAVYQTLLFRYTGQEELLVGCPTSGRLHSRFEMVVGYFVNPVALRVKIAPDLTFKRFLEQVKNTTLGALAHQEFPFALLVDRLQPERDLSRTPVFQSMFVFEQAPAFSSDALSAFVLGEQGGQLQAGPLLLESCRLDVQSAQFDLTMAAAPAGDGLSVSLQYSTDLFESRTIARMLDHYLVLVEGILANPGQAVSDLPLLTAAERRQLLLEFNATRRDYPRGLCLHHLFENQVRKTPDAVAVMDGEEQVTYAELNARAGRLAEHLKRAGVGPEAPAGILMRRGTGMVAAILGILKAGGAYVPLDPAYPQERLSFTLEDAQVKVLLADSNLVKLATGYGGAVMCPETLAGQPLPDSPAPPRAQVTERNLAYLIYTSGSTGRPKGAAIEHRSAVTLMHWAQEVFRAEELAGVLCSTSICFDLSIFELFLPLSVGGTAVVVRDVLELLSYPGTDSITLINTVPSALRELARQGGIPESAATVNLAGEALLREVVDEAYAQPSVARVFNLYGPSEDTTYSTFSLVGRRDAEPPTVGRPVANSQVYIMKDGHLLPAGLAGELCIGGAGLARGYLHRPDLTAEKFLPDPFAMETGARLYRTGDLARYRPNGEIEYLGRFDHQVKVRGFRIELGEIEACIGRHPAVREAVVVAREDRPGEKHLVAYLVYGSGQQAQAAELRDHLKASLPEFMVPHEFVALEAMPLTRNGKIDRKALPAPAARASGAPGPPQSRTAVEELIAGIWADVLHREQFSVTDNFFELGGHSLNTTQVASRIKEALGVDLQLRALFEAPTIQQLARLVEDAAHSPAASTKFPIPVVSRHDDLPLSFAQQRLWSLHQIEPESTAYNILYSARFTGELNIPAVEQALNEIVRRHEALRTRFRQAESGPVQVIEAGSILDVPMVSVQSLAGEAGERVARDMAVSEARRRFDLAAGPLLRALLVPMGRRAFRLMISMHHVISDGWSLGVFVRELASLYQSFTSGVPSELPDLTIQYADFACWQRQWLESEVLETQLVYWKEKLAEAPAALDLPVDRPRSLMRRSDGATLPFRLPAELVKSLTTLSRSADVTLFMTLMAGLQALLARYSGQDDIVVGTPIANRGRLELEPLIGYFANTLVMRTDFSGDPSFRDLLARVREVALGAYAHQDVPLERIVSELQPDRDLSRAPLFQIVLALQNAPVGDLQLAGVRLEPEAIAGETVKFDMTVQLTNAESGISGQWEYNTYLFEEATIGRMMDHFKVLLESIASHPDRRVSELSFLSPAERRQALTEWNATTRPYPQRGLPELFEAQVEQTPDSVALSYHDECLTYRELNERANRLARYLVGHGIGPESRVALVMERSPELVIAALAIVKAGGAYVAIELSNPLERIEFLLADVKPALILAQQKLMQQIPQQLQAGVFCVDVASPALDRQSGANLGLPLSLDQLAYISYTSGSTGAPKGVSVPHRGVVRLVCNADCAALGPGQVFLQMAPLAFDASTLEIWGCFLNGGRLVVMPAGPVSIENLARILQRYEVSILWLTAGLFHTVVEHGLEALAGVRQVLAGGDVLSVVHTRKFLESAADGSALINGYGPTENTTFTACYRMERNSRIAESVPIGRPIANTRVYLLDGHMNLVSVGMCGELFAGGAGLARGYWNRAEMTAEQFVPNPFGDEAGGRLYRTGDLARWRPDGTLEYLSRRDNQIKLRGFRVELGEIEAVLAQHPEISECVVVARQDVPGEKHLVAYVVARGPQAPAPADLRSCLAEQLPEYMVPAAFVVLPELPLSANGKVDRKALPQPEYGGDGQDYVAPVTAAEKLLAGVWEAVLNVPRVGIHDNFFGLGGDSIMAIQVVAKAKREGLKITVERLFKNQTIARLVHGVGVEANTGPGVLPEGVLTDAAAKPVRGPGGYTTADFPRIRVTPAELEALLDGLPESVPVDLIEDIYPLTSLQQGILFHVLDSPQSGLYLNQQSYTIEGVLDSRLLRMAFGQVVARHPMLRTAFLLSAYGSPFQVVLRHAELPWEERDWSGLTESEQQQKLRNLLQADREQEFQLSGPPLIRVNLVRLAEDRHEFIWSLHLIAFDGWSLPLIYQEVLAIYDALKQARPADLSLPPPFVAYVDWLQRQDADQAEAYWRQTLEGFHTPTAMGDDLATADLSRAQNFHREDHLWLDEAETAALWAAGARHEITVNTLIQGAWALLISRRSGTGDVVFGSVVSGRPPDLSGVESIIGLFLNTLPVRVRVTPGADLAVWLKALQQQQAEARRYEFTPLVDIQRWSGIARGQVLFESVVIFQNIPINVPLSQPGGRLKVAASRSIERNNYALTLVAEPGPRLRLKLVYDSRRFSSAMGARLLRQVQKLLAEMAGNERCALGSLSAGSETERTQLISSFNQDLE